MRFRWFMTGALAATAALVAGTYAMAKAAERRRQPLARRREP